eukprot:scaffold48_cov311-Pinguiococcus_pyrenoidosus.AAC.305
MLPQNSSASKRFFKSLRSSSLISNFFAFQCVPLRPSLAVLWAAGFVKADRGCRRSGEEGSSGYHA